MSEIRLGDIRLREHTLDTLPRLAELRRQCLARKPAICIERARYVTEYLRDLDDGTDAPEVRQARKVAHFLERKAPVVHDANLLAGSTTSKPLGAPLFPEYFALSLWPELESVSQRARNPQLLSPDEARELNDVIFPFWMEQSVLELTRKRFGNFRALRLFEDISFFIAGKAGCISHTVPTYQPALERGLQEEVARATDLEARKVREGDDDAADFYRAARIALESILAHARRLAAHCELLASAATDEAERKNLSEMAAVCRRVPARPPTTFREAVNAVWLCQVAIHAENINMAMSPGRLDQVLYPFYERDVAEGRLDVASALELVGCLWLKLADNVDMVPDASEQLFGGAGSVPAVTLGGVDLDGADAVNDLTYIMLRATELLRIRDPNVNARYHVDVNRREYRDRVAGVIASTKAVPAVYNDVANVAVLEAQGEQTAHARDYAVIGCVELSSAGREYAASSSIILNLVAPLEMALFRGKRPVTGDEQIGYVTADPATMTSFAEFWEAFTTQLDWVIDQAIDVNEKLALVHQEVMPSPLLSWFIEGPREKGRDLTRGGATYNSSGATHIGFADVTDSLSAIDELVFRQKAVTFAALIEAIRTDFAGPEGERLRQRLLHQAPKYGTQHLVALRNAKLLVRHLFEVYQRHVNYRGGPYRPAYWTMTNHAGLGAVCGALPSGRKAGATLASGITPVSGAAPDLVECLHSVASVAGKEIAGGWALNLKYTPDEDEDRMATRLGDMVESFFRMGGHQVQFNLMTYAMLLDAREHPEKYPELMVRVSGYSAYFNDLNERMKDELITRAQYDLATGTAVEFPGQGASHV